MSKPTLFERLLHARIQAGVTDPEMLAFCEREARAFSDEVNKQIAMSSEERANHAAQAQG